MRKTMSLILAVLFMFCCANFAMAEEKTTVTVWSTGSQNTADLTLALAEAYNAKEDANYHVECQHILSGTGDEGLTSRVAAAYLAGKTNTNFDLILNDTPSYQNFVDECGSEDIFLDYDASKIVGLENVLVTPTLFPTKLVPFRCTTVLFAYDSARIPEEELPHTWDELADWIKNHPGRFAYNDPDTGGAGGGFVRSAVYRFIDDPAAKTSGDEKWVEQYDEGLQWLADLHPYMYQSGGHVLYPNKNQGTIDLLINQEVDLIPAWADMILLNVANGTLPETTRMYQLDDVPLTGNDVSAAIPSIGSNPDGAYEFISFIISPEGQKICLEVMKAIPVIDPATIDSDQQSLVEGLDNYDYMSIGNLWSEYLYPMWMETILPLG